MKSITIESWFTNIDKNEVSFMLGDTKAQIPKNVDHLLKSGLWKIEMGKSTGLPWLNTKLDMSKYDVTIEGIEEYDVDVDPTSDDSIDITLKNGNVMLKENKNYDVKKGNLFVIQTTKCTFSESKPNAGYDTVKCKLLK